MSSKQSNRAKPQSKLAKLVKKLNGVQETAATAPTTGNGSPARLGGTYGERLARAVSRLSNLFRKGRGHGAATSISGTASRSRFLLSRREKKTNTADNSGSLGNTDAVNTQTPQIEASSAVSDFPANPAGVVKRKPGCPVGSGLLRDKKLLEPTRLSKRLRRRSRSTSPPILQASQDNTANLQHATGDLPNSPIDANPRDLDATAESPLKRKRGRPVGSTEAYLLARELQADIVKNEPPSPAEGSPSKPRRTDKS